MNPSDFSKKFNEYENIAYTLAFSMTEGYKNQVGREAWGTILEHIYSCVHDCISEPLSQYHRSEKHSRDFNTLLEQQRKNQTDIGCAERGLQQKRPRDVRELELYQARIERFQKEFDQLHVKKLRIEAQLPIELEKWQQYITTHRDMIWNPVDHPTAFAHASDLPQVINYSVRNGTYRFHYNYCSTDISKSDIVDIQNTAHPTADQRSVPGKFIYHPGMNETMLNHRRHADFLGDVSRMLQLPKWLGCYCNEDQNKCGKPNKAHTPDIAILHHPASRSNGLDIPVFICEIVGAKTISEDSTDFDVTLNALQMLSFMQTAYVLEVKHAQVILHKFQRTGENTCSIADYRNTYELVPQRKDFPHTVTRLVNDLVYAFTDTLRNQLAIAHGCSMYHFAKGYRPTHLHVKPQKAIIHPLCWHLTLDNRDVYVDYTRLENESFMKAWDEDMFDEFSDILGEGDNWAEKHDHPHYPPIGTFTNYYPLLNAFNQGGEPCQTCAGTGCIPGKNKIFRNESPSAPQQQGDDDDMPPLEGDEEMHHDLVDEPIESTEAPRRKTFGRTGFGRSRTGLGQPMDSGDRPIFGPTGRGRRITRHGQPMEIGEGQQPGFSGTCRGKESQNKPVRGGTGGRGKGRGNETVN